jgi:hypothetical protein
MALFRRPAPKPIQSPPSPPPRTRLGEPGTCPSCGGQGFLDHIDLTHDRQTQHCKSCGHRWVISLSGTDSDPLDEERAEPRWKG